MPKGLGSRGRDEPIKPCKCTAVGSEGEVRMSDEEELLGGRSSGRETAWTLRHQQHVAHTRIETHRHGNHRERKSSRGTPGRSIDAERC